MENEERTVHRRKPINSRQFKNLSVIDVIIKRLSIQPSDEENRLSIAEPSCRKKSRENVYSKLPKRKLAPPLPPPNGWRPPIISPPPRRMLQAEVNNQSQIKYLVNYKWYWGKLSMEAAGQKLRYEQDGTFLVRHSTIDKYVFVLSFRSRGLTLHVRIDEIDGFYSLLNVQKYSVVATLITSIIELSKQGKIYCYTKEMHNKEMHPVILLYPYDRYFDILPPNIRN